VLQGARSAVISESNGRYAGFLTTTSATVVALTLVSQAAESSEALLYFALAVFPALVYLGATTFVRVVQLGATEGFYIQGMNRIRHYFVNAVPAVKPHVTLPTEDDLAGITRASLIPLADGRLDGG
jgi:hypothetical protein